MSEQNGTPLLASRAEVRIEAAPAEVYATVSDLSRSGEWSPECRGGSWIQGEPGAVGAVFRGENVRSEEVVSWAPVVRGAWTTYAEVVDAQPGRTFLWAMRDSAGRKQQSVWGFDIEADGEGSVLVHHFRMDAPTEGILGITAEMDEERKRRFFTEWGEKVAGDLAETLRRIKPLFEKAG
ncbi:MULTISPECIES: SRPBCC family protein [unclassified Streptomyces]|uniref:SRPBCC family protein n=1 Tax=unclassified Streptomyces TaxID=2593676 RepID=UPI000DACD87D|nr:MULTISPECIES: SRPBCC family protein [unclassified Streptomyces]PZT74849.1 SRPBCC family protein [Streptomyces sp. AC1-42T]PZT82167.1 SRPBCC family protein [Streptomyces sp. AC1-42W]